MFYEAAAKPMAWREDTICFLFGISLLNEFAHVCISAFPHTFLFMAFGVPLRLVRHVRYIDYHQTNPGVGCVGIKNHTK